MPSSNYISSSFLSLATKLASYIRSSLSGSRY